METILITGASGTIGQQLVPLLLKEGYHLKILSRKKSMKNKPLLSFYKWNIDSNYIEEGALDEVDHIIHLAGSPVSKRWTKKRKQEILDSRIKGASLLFDQLNHSIKTFISASGISIYGTHTSETIFKETEQIVIGENDFLADVTKVWEESADQFNAKAKRVVKLRTPVVMSKTGGALERIAKPIQMRIGSALGSGKQWVPWVHISDLCQAYLVALKNDNVKGSLNVVAPEHISNEDLTKAIAKKMKRRILMPRVPGFLLKMLFGQMAGIILKGSRVDGAKTTTYEYDYSFKTIESALDDLL